MILNCTHSPCLNSQLSLALYKDTMRKQTNLSGARVCLGGACGLLLGGGLLLRDVLGGHEARGLCVRDGVRGATA
jgi:hypothetical protein